LKINIANNSKIKKHIKQINIDLERTYPHIKKFNNDDNLNKLGNILKCFCKRNEQIGYIQGMNFIAG